MMRAGIAALIVAASALGFHPATSSVHLAAAAAGLKADATSEPAPESPTFARDIAPLLNDRCAMCHHPDGSAPFSLLTYDDAKRHATQIAAATRSRYMPPWKVDPADGPFIGQKPLTVGEIDLIQRWVDGGAVEGEGVSPRPPVPSPYL